MGSKKKVNGTAPMPLVQNEYIDMLREYKKGAKRQRALVKQESPGPSGPQSSLSRGNNTSEIPEQERSPSLSPQLPQASQLVPYGSDGDSEFDSDDFEDVELDNGPGEHNALFPESSELGDAQLRDVQISLDENQASHLSRKAKRKGLRKPQRLAMHKVSLMAWMHHARMRNKWLMDPELLDNPQLKQIMPDFILGEVFPREHLTPFLKSRQFVEGVRHIMESWQQVFKVVRPGLACDQEANAGSFGDSGNRDEYHSQLLTFEGSADLMGQGLVALLRSIGLTVRLVCSLQPPDNLGADTTLAPAKSKATESACPIFWAEVWDEYTSKWMSVDPLTSTLKLPTRTKVKLKLEPPQSDRFNVMRYCIALDSKNNCRDVTRRYAKEFNSRTRKKRLPHFESERWLDHFLGLYAKKEFTSLDKEELLELSKYPRAEGIPTRVQDFVGHPIYALADHLRSDEIIKPDASPCGVLSANSKTRAKPASGNGATTYIYRRSDVETVRSSQSWYKRARSIKVGQQPMARRKVRNRLTGELDSVALYALHQTEPYIPEPVDSDGVVPKSQYRTIDIFTRSMIPKGGYYIRSKLGTAAAKLLKVDYANVVTGVDFGKNGPQSRMFGVIVADRYAEAVNEVIHGLRVIEAEGAERSERLRILALWRKFILGIQIWDRVESMNPSYHSETEPRGEDSENRTEKTESSDTGPRNTYSEMMLGAQSQNVDAAAQPQVSQRLIKANDIKSEDDSDLEILDSKPVVSKPLVSKSVNIKIDTAKLIRVQEKVAELRDRQRTSFATYSGLKSATYARAKPDSVGSPDSYHSFSDLDVDEISESEL